MQRPGQRPDRGGDRRGHVRAGGGDHPGGERGGVHAVLGRGHEVGVDRLDVVGVRLAAPADHEPLDDRLGLVDLALRHGRQPEPAGRLGHERHRGDRDPGQVVAGLLLVDVDELIQPPVRRHHRDRALHVDPDVAGVHRDRERLGRRQPGVELAVHQQAPDVAEGHPADEVLDVDPPVAQRAAFLVRLGDLGLEGDDALQPRLEVLGHAHSPTRLALSLPSCPPAVTLTTPDTAGAAGGGKSSGA